CEVGLDSQIGRQRFISLLFLLRARRVTGGKRTSTIRISPFLPQSGPNACAQRNETGSPETTSKTLSIATSHQPRIALYPPDPYRHSSTEMGSTSMASTSDRSSEPSMEPRPAPRDAASDPVAQPDHHAATARPIPGTPPEPLEVVRRAHPWRRRLLFVVVL